MFILGDYLTVNTKHPLLKIFYITQFKIITKQYFLKNTVFYYKSEVLHYIFKAKMRKISYFFQIGSYVV